MSRAKQSRTDLYVVSACLLLSGAGSLVLEVVWSRLLKLEFGSTTLAISTILVAYMLGLGLGGLLGGKIARRFKDGVRAYGLFEMGIALYAFTVPHLLEVLPFVQRNVLAELPFWPAALVRFAIVLVVLLIPTLLMGATLPILVATLVRSRSHLADRVGMLYGVNTLGAVLGVVGSSFVLFGWLGVYGTNVFGASLDFTVGAIAAFVLAPRLRRARATAPAPAEEKIATASAGVVVPKPRRLWNVALISYGVVGFTALAYEVCWTRALSMVTGSSIYAFAVMLAAFLTGIALGSIVARRWFDRLRNPHLAYAFGITALGVLALVTVFSFSRFNDVFLWIVTLVGVEGIAVVVTAMVASFLAMIGPTLVLGALFPLVTKAASVDRPDSSKVVADVYFANTIGSATGAFAAGFLLIPSLGLQLTMAILMALNFVTAAVVLVVQSEWRSTSRFAVVGILVVAGVVLVARPPVWDKETMTLGAYYKPDAYLTHGIDTKPLVDFEAEELLYYKDGLNTTVSIHRSPGGVNLRLGGKPDASLGDMSTQTLSAHIPMSFGKPATEVLVIGYASGVTVGSASLYGPERVDAIELEPAVMEASRYFDPYNHGAQDRDNVRIIIDDGRGFLTKTDETYDVIISEPSNPWISGAANLFTREYFELAKSRLNPDGRLLQWIQLYGMDGAALRSVWRAVRSEFEYVYGFLSTIRDVDFLMLATNTPLEPGDLPEWNELSQEVREDLRRVGVYTTEDLWSLMRITPEQFDRILAENPGPVNTDDNMFVELRAPWTIYRAAQEHLQVVQEFETGVLGIFEPEEVARLDGGRLGMLAMSYLARRDDDVVAQAIFAEAVRRPPTPGMLLAVAQVTLQEGEMPVREKRERALRALDDALRIDPYHKESLLQRSELREAIGDVEGALQDANRAIAVDPEDHRSQHQKISLLGRLGRFEEARLVAQKLDEEGIAVFDWGVWPKLAVSAAASGQYEFAEEVMRRFLEYVPYSPQEWAILAEIYKRMDRPEDAQAALANAQISEENRTAELHREAMTALLFGGRTAAQKMLERVIERDPNNQRAREDLARIRSESGRGAR